MAVPRKLTFGRALTQVRLAPKFPCRQQHPRLRAGNALRPPSLPVPARTRSRGDRRAAPLAHSAERAGQTHEAERVRRESPRTDPAPSHRHPTDEQYVSTKGLHRQAKGYTTTIPSYHIALSSQLPQLQPYIWVAGHCTLSQPRDPWKQSRTDCSQG